MIHPSTKVRCIDLDSEQHMHLTLDRLFTQYSHMMQCGDDNDITFKIDYADKNLVIQDGYGWTQLLSIEKKRLHPNAGWYKIIGDHDEVIMTGDSLIPVFTPSKTKTGFHGSVMTKFGYLLLRDFSGDMSHTVKRRTDGPHVAGEDQEFTAIRIEELTDRDPDYGFVIVTKSKFCTGNHLYLNGSGDFDITEAKKNGWV